MYQLNIFLQSADWGLRLVRGGLRLFVIAIKQLFAFVSSPGVVLIGGYSHILHCPPRLLLSNGYDAPEHGLVLFYICGPCRSGIFTEAGDSWMRRLSSCGSMVYMDHVVT